MLPLPKDPSLLSFSERAKLFAAQIERKENEGPAKPLAAKRLPRQLTKSFAPKLAATDSLLKPDPKVVYLQDMIRATQGAAAGYVAESIKLQMHGIGLNVLLRLKVVLEKTQDTNPTPLVIREAIQDSILALEPQAPVAAVAPAPAASEQ